MSITAEVRWVCREASVPVAKMFYAAGGEGLFRAGVVGCSGHGYRSRFTTVRVSTGGEWMVGVLLEKGFDSRE